MTRKVHGVVKQSEDLDELAILVVINPEQHEMAPPLRATGDV